MPRAAGLGAEAVRQFVNEGGLAAARFADEDDGPRAFAAERLPHGVDGLVEFVGVRQPAGLGFEGEHRAEGFERIEIDVVFDAFLQPSGEQGAGAAAELAHVFAGGAEHGKFRPGGCGGPAFVFGQVLVDGGGGGAANVGVGVLGDGGEEGGHYGGGGVGEGAGGLLADAPGAVAAEAFDEAWFEGGPHGRGGDGGLAHGVVVVGEELTNRPVERLPGRAFGGLGEGQADGGFGVVGQAGEDGVYIRFRPLAAEDDGDASQGGVVGEGKIQQRPRGGDVGPER